MAPSGVEGVEGGEAMTDVAYWQIAPMVFTFGTEDDADAARDRWERDTERREAHRSARPDAGDADAWNAWVDSAP